MVKSINFAKKKLLMSTDSDHNKKFQYGHFALADE